MPPTTPPPVTGSEPEIFRAFGARLRREREKKKLSLLRLGRRAGVNWSYIGQIERGVANPTLLIMARLAMALQVDLGVFTTGLPDPPPGPEQDY
jgi:transcriptional regulator with XRE-family HTH domain